MPPHHRLIVTVLAVTLELQGTTAGQNDAPPAQLFANSLVGRARMKSIPYATQICDALGTTLAELASMRPFKCPGNQASLGRALRARRNCDDETGSLACAVAVRREGSVVGLDDRAGDRQPET